MFNNQDIQRLASTLNEIAEEPKAKQWATHLRAAADLLRRYADNPLMIEVTDPHGNTIATIDGDVARKIHTAALIEFFERSLA